MRSTPFFLLLVSLLGVSAAGCSSRESEQGPAEESELRISARTSVSGLKFGKYTGREDAEEGFFTQLKLSPRRRGVAREFDGVFTGKIKHDGREKFVKGGFQIIRKRIPAPQLVQGSRIANVLKIMAQGESPRELVYQYVQNTLVLSDVATTGRDHEEFLDMVENANGDRPFSLSCSLKELHDDNVFEEGLSMDEYPSIGIEQVDGKWEVDIGAHSYDEPEDRIVVEDRSGSDITLKIGDATSFSYRVTVKDKKGTIDAFENDGESKVADFRCR